MLWGGDEQDAAPGLEDALRWSKKQGERGTNWELPQLLQPQWVLGGFWPLQCPFFPTPNASIMDLGAHGAAQISRMQLQVLGAQAEM